MPNLSHQKGSEQCRLRCGKDGGCGMDISLLLHPSKHLQAAGQGLGSDAWTTL